jgi:hypothetical protein
MASADKGLEEIPEGKMLNPQLVTTARRQPTNGSLHYEKLQVKSSPTMMRPSIRLIR